MTMSLPKPNDEVLARLDAVLAAPKGRRVGVLGLGIAGRAMALHLVRRGAKVLGADRNPNLEDPELVKAGVEMVLGSVAGGVAGQAAEQAGTRQTGYEITVRLDNGQMIAVTQAADEAFKPGDRVRLLSDGGTTRVTH